MPLPLDTHNNHQQGRVKYLSSIRNLRVIGLRNVPVKLTYAMVQRTHVYTIQLLVETLIVRVGNVNDLPLDFLVYFAETLELHFEDEALVYLLLTRGELDVGDVEVTHF